MRRVAPYPQWEIFSSYGLLGGGILKDILRDEVLFINVRSKGRFYTLPHSHTSYQNAITKCSWTKGVQSGAGKCGLYRTHLWATRRHQQTRRQKLAHNCVPRGFIFTVPNKIPNSHTVFFGCDIQRINVNQTVFKAAFVLLFFCFREMFFSAKTPKRCRVKDRAGSIWRAGFTPKGGVSANFTEVCRVQK